jgi:hypothetical protein
VRGWITGCEVIACWPDLFLACGKEVNEQYRVRSKTIIAGLRRNVGLCWSLLSGEKAPEVLLTMQEEVACVLCRVTSKVCSPTVVRQEFATDEDKKWLQQCTQEALRAMSAPEVRVLCCGCRVV